MKIDPITGMLSIGMNSITPNFLNSSLELNANELLNNRERCSYTFRLTEDQAEFGINLRFKNEILSEVCFAIANPDDSWGNWSDDRERKKQTQIDNLIKQSLGLPPYIFGWGEVIAEIDPRGGFSQGILRYRI